MDNVPEARRFEIVMDEHETLGALLGIDIHAGTRSFLFLLLLVGAYLGDQDKVFIQKEWFAGKITDYQGCLSEQMDKNLSFSTLI